MCIGPYAQANVLSCVSRIPDHGALIYVAGQIPLDPATMTVNPFFETKPQNPKQYPQQNPQLTSQQNPEVSLLDALLLQLTLSIRHCARVLQPLGEHP